MSKYSKPNRVPRQKLNTIEVRWAKGKGDSGEDFWSVWGEGTCKGTANLCLDAISKLGKELDKRGYDLRSLKFSVKKRPVSLINV